MKQYSHRISVALALLALASLTISSCRKEPSDIVIGENTNGETLFIIDEFVQEGETKTELAPGDDCTVVWSDGDLVGVFPKDGYQEPFSIPAILSGLPSAAFDDGGWAMKKGLDYCAYYPFDIENFESSECKTSIPVTYIGQSQTGSVGEVGRFDYTYSDWQTAGDEAMTFTMHHIGALAVINLSIPQGGTYTKLRLDAEDAVLPVTGHYDLTAQQPAFIPDTFASSISLELKDFSAKVGETCSFYLMMPPCDLSNAALSVTLEMPGGYYLFDVGGSKKFEASRLHQVPCTMAKVGTRGSAKACYKGEDTYVNWVQLWPGGPRFAEVNLENGNQSWTESRSANDAARLMWGDYWYVPTKADMTELYIAATEGAGSTRISARRSGNEIVFEGKIEGYTDNSLGLPSDLAQMYDIAACYWTGTDNLALCLQLTQHSTITDHNGWHTYWGGGVSNGNLVRPVCALLNYIGTVSSLELDRTSLKLTKGSTETIRCTALPESALQVVEWTSSDENVVKVSENGDVTGISAGVATVTATSMDGTNVSASCKVEVVYSAAADLGLSVKWSEVNVGAEAPEDCGYYFAWGEVETKESFGDMTYRWGEEYDLRKYCTTYRYGKKDDKTSLDAEDDIATVTYGGTWRIPTVEEMNELKTKCTWKWTTLNGVNGYEVTGPSKKSIFLPVAGYYDYTGFNDAGSIGQYWSKSLDVEDNNRAHILKMSSTGYECIVCGRFDGLTVRPVCQ